MYTALATLRDALKKIEGVSTCKIGRENGESPDDYPLIRLVPVRFAPNSKSYDYRIGSVSIYFGWNVGETQDDGDADGLEYVYKQLSRMEDEILKVLKAQGHKYIDTITDQDQLEPYKLMVARCEMKVKRPEEDPA